ncbi:MAG: endonuclease/exonuclease/phosphatase family protein [Myxococcota bacterium]|nr:endonuclease/exonuclease/phosphatase family protein [Myxococcota bacterium]
MPLRVMTLNLWHDSGPWPEREKLVREWIDRLEPDLIGFQEALRVPSGEQVEGFLVDRGCHVDFVEASPFWKTGREHDAGVVGNALASRWPIESHEALRLPESGDGEKRAALSVTVRSPHGPLGFTVTHLNWKLDHGWIREQQVEAVCELALRRRPEGGFPPILVGDFNAEPDSAEIRYVTGRQSRNGRSVCFLDAWERAGAGDGITWSNRNPYARLECEPDRRIDYVFVGVPRQKDGRGQILACRVVCNEDRGGVWSSDHFGVYAELRTEPIATGAP